MTKSTETQSPRLSSPAGPSEERPGYWIVRHSKSIIFLAVTLALIGGYLAFTIPVAVFPSTDFPRILIGADNGVTPINQMLVTVTRPIEEAVNSVPGLEDVRSITSRGSAEIDLFFNWNVDMFQTLQLVNAAMAQVQGTLPPTARIESHRLTFASFPIIGYSLTSDTVPQTQLWELATYEMKPRLNRLNGVSTVLVQGGEVPEFQITPDASKLLRAQVTVPEILQAVGSTNLIASPGLLEQNHQLFLTLVDAQAHAASEISNIIAKTTPGGLPVRIGDVADVHASVEPVYTIVTANGKPGVLLSIDRQPSSNTVQVADEVHAEMEQIKRTLPPGVTISSYYDQSDIVKSSIQDARDTILIGLVLASIVLVVFLRDWGTSLVAGLVIPVTILVTFIVLKIVGETFNLMTLGGLAAAVGLVIDDAIVVVENIVLHRDAGEERIEAIHSALSEITVPLIGSTLTPIVVFLPLIAITGVTGTFFRALAITMAAALFTSLALALVWTPNLSRYFIHTKRAESNPRADAEEIDSADRGEEISLRQREMNRLMAAEEASMRGFFGRVITFYERWARRALEHPIWLVGLCAILLVASYFCYKALGSDLLPAMDEGGFIVDYIMPAGSSLEETNRVIAHLEKMITAVPEVSSVSRRTGLQLGLATVTEANTGDISVKLKGKRSRSVYDIIAQLREEFAQREPSVDIEFVQMLQDMIGDLTSAPEPVRIELFSPDADLLGQWAPRVADAISAIQVSGKKPVVDVLNGIDNSISGPAVTFKVNPSVAERAGFTPEEVSTDAEAILEGTPAPTPVVANDRAYTIRVRFPDANRASLAAMSDTLLVSSSGQTATLGSLSTIAESPGQTEILRDNLQREVAVTARFEGLDLGSGIRAVQKTVDGLHLPSSIRVEYGGLYKEQQKSFHDLVVVLVLALALVFIVLLFEFGGFAGPLAILTSALLSTSGVLFALWITGVTFNISSFMGLIMVIGIVAKNGILLLDADQKFRAAGFSPEEAMIQAGRRRLRPIVMTALAAMSGMLPLALAWGAGSQMLQPLAIAVIGGILISMVLSLIITPAMYFNLSRERTK
ncbi:MAG TPA: efflux RND transporter permease subunit [Candidatus Acidoferrales bacterium]|nr:efflux RND transporter permease subunit [Candidatus Acidoferrales bacterium]